MTMTDLNDAVECYFEGIDAAFRDDGIDVVDGYALLAQSFRANQSHISDCFADTLYLARQYGIDKDELEIALVAEVMRRAKT